MEFSIGLDGAVWGTLKSLVRTQDAAEAAAQAALAQLVPQLAVQLLIDHPRQTDALRNTLLFFRE